MKYYRDPDACDLSELTVVQNTILRTLSPSFGKTNSASTLKCVFFFQNISVWSPWHTGRLSPRFIWRIGKLEQWCTIEKPSRPCRWALLTQRPVFPSAFRTMPCRQCLSWRHRGRLRRAGDWEFHGRAWCLRWRDGYQWSQMVDPAGLTRPCLSRKAEDGRRVSHPLYFCHLRHATEGALFVVAWLTSEPKLMGDEYVPLIALLSCLVAVPMNCSILLWTSTLILPVCLDAW